MIQLKDDQSTTTIH